MIRRRIGEARNGQFDLEKVVLDFELELINPIGNDFDNEIVVKVLAAIFTDAIPRRLFLE